MTNKIIEELASHRIHGYGSDELYKFEKQMERYFKREYERWRGNKELPENYGVSSYQGDIARKETHTETIEHYNKELKIYQAFLDKEYMAYSMAFFGATENCREINNNISLEQAQIEKYKLIIKRADIKDGHHILDLGCGFGGFVKYLLQTFPNVKITGVNPSIVQSNHIHDELKNNSRFQLVQSYIGDANEDTLPHNSYDRIVSIGALEHFENFDLLFQHLKALLKPGGKCFHHIIVSADTIPQFLKAESTLMSNYFPGGHIWPFFELTRHTQHLKLIDSWFVNGLNYWKTLDEWHKRFWDAIDQLYPNYLSLDEVIEWNKYFVLCKAMFSPNKGMSYGNGQYLFEKTKDMRIQLG